MSLRSLARKAKISLVRSLQGLSLQASSPRDFLEEVIVRMRDPAMARYLASEGGAGRWLSGICEAAREDAQLRETLVKSEIGGAFRAFYISLLNDEKLRPELIEHGIDDVYRFAYLMAQEAKLPLAQRAETFSQEGEDLIVGRLFDGVQSGFFVDVGAHHPFRFSNTWLLYRRGWRGINIDATPGTMKAFQRWRPDDINIECLVSTDTTSRPYFLHDEPALNTMSEELVKRRAVESPQYRVVETIMLESRPLSSILERHLPPGQAIDFLNIDVEGHDMDVLQSNDWERFVPRVIAVEILATGLADIEQNQVYRFLAERGYRLYAKMFNSAIFTSGSARQA